MVTELNEWLDFGRCQKCGATVPRIVYMEDGSGWDKGWPRHCSHKAPHFHCQCWRCGYKWEADPPQPKEI